MISIKKMSGSTYDKLFKVFNKRAVNYSDCSMDDLVYAISKGRSFMAQRKNGHICIGDEFIIRRI